MDKAESKQVSGIEVAVDTVDAETGAQEPFVRMKVDVSIAVDANADSATTERILGDLTQCDDFTKLEEDIRIALNGYMDPDSEGIPDGDGNVRVEIKDKIQVRRSRVRHH
jgi:hypothetical protein